MHTQKGLISRKFLAIFSEVLNSRVPVIIVLSLRNCRIKGILCSLHMLCGEVNQSKKCTSLRERSQLIYSKGTSLFLAHKQVKRGSIG